jgi:glycosyltransferase involved in cell wall biosynthesis
LKVLIIGGYISKEKRGGAGIAVWEICKAISKTEDVYWLPLTSMSDFTTLFRKSITQSGVKVIYKNFPPSVLINMVMEFFSRGLKSISRYANKLSRRIYYASLYAYGKAYCEYIISVLKPDIVHIHGFNILSYPFFSAAINQGVPTIGTAHGLNSLNRNIIKDYDKAMESDLMRKVINSGGAITLVSTKDNTDIIKEFNIPSTSTHVVLNGVDFNRFGQKNMSKMELRKKYGIPLNRKIFLHVAALNKRKNHMEVLKALNNMDKTFRDELLYLVVGGGSQMDILHEYVYENGLSSNVIFKGSLYGNTLVDFYHLSDLFILSSTSEGFPLVFLEAMASGLPIVTFKDLEGVADISNPIDCLELIQERSTTSIINAMRIATEKNWDREKIKETAKKYSWDCIGKQYITIYDMVIKNFA